MINLKFQSSGESSKIQTFLYEERYWLNLSVLLILSKLVWIISLFLLRCEIAGGIWVRVIWSDPLNVFVSFVHSKFG